MTAVAGDKGLFMAGTTLTATKRDLASAARLVTPVLQSLSRRKARSIPELAAEVEAPEADVYRALFVLEQQQLARSLSYEITNEGREALR